MYYVYDCEGEFVGKMISWTWAVKMADYYEGWIKEHSEYFDGLVIVYDTWEFSYLI